MLLSCSEWESVASKKWEGTLVGHSVLQVSGICTFYIRQKMLKYIFYKCSIPIQHSYCNTLFVKCVAIHKTKYIFLKTYNFDCFCKNITLTHTLTGWQQWVNQCPNQQNPNLITAVLFERWIVDLLYCINQVLVFFSFFLERHRR